MNRNSKQLDRPSRFVSTMAVWCFSQIWDLADTVGVAHFPSITPDRGVIGIARLHACCFSNPGGVATGDHRPPPPTWRTATLGEEAEAQSLRPVPVGLVLWSLGRMAFGSLHRQTGNRHRVAPEGISTVLDLEGSPRPTRPPTGVEGSTQTDSQDEPRQPPFARSSPPHSPPHHRH